MNALDFNVHVDNPVLAVTQAREPSPLTRDGTSGTGMICH
jgi:hypothetical protein